jgi:hypothetical protein
MKVNGSRSIHAIDGLKGDLYTQTSLRQQWPPFKWRVDCGASAGKRDEQRPSSRCYLDDVLQPPLSSRSLCLFTGSLLPCQHRSSLFVAAATVRRCLAAHLSAILSNEAPLLIANRLFSIWAFVNRIHFHILERYFRYEISRTFESRLMSQGLS